MKQKGIPRFLFYTLVILALGSPGVLWAETEIVHWDFFKPSDGSIRGNALGENIKRFQAKNPDIRVKVEVVTFAEVDSKLIQSAAAGSTPDTLRVWKLTLPMHVAAGTIQPLDKYAEKMDKNDWLIPWNSTVISGKKYALPLEYRFLALLYRKDILDKGNVKVPATWDDMCQAAGKVNSQQVMGYAFGISQNDPYYMMEFAENLIMDAGGKLFDEKGRAGFNNQAGLKYFQLIADMVGKCHGTGKAVSEFTYNEVHDGLKVGSIAMASLGTHRFDSIRASGAGDNLQWAPSPSFEKGKSGAAQVIGWNMAMGTHAKHPDAAWKFMEYMSSPEAQMIIAQGGEMPTRKSTYNDPWFKTPRAATMREWADFIGKHGRLTPWYPPTWNDLGQILSEGAQSVVLKGVAPQKALAEVVERYNSKVK